jgi:propionyl-CoA carboxylase beta chain
MTFTGTCDLLGEDDRESILQCRELLRYLPQSCREKPLSTDPGDDPARAVEELQRIVPDAFEETYDMHEVIRLLVDRGEFFEIKDGYARNLIAGFCRFNGAVAGLVANNPVHGGCILEVDACDQYDRFLQVLDADNSPLGNLVDTPPVVPGEKEEARGLLRHMGKIADVYATSTIPKISIILREAYADAGSMIMGGVKGMGADLTFAWPIARFAVEASNLDYRRIYGKGIEEDAYDAYLHRAREKVDVFEVSRSWTAQMVDEIIEPKDTRRKIIEALEITRDKVETLPARAKSHGAPPT